MPLAPAGEGFAVESAYLHYNKNLAARARENRKNPTMAENKIWNEVLRMRQFAGYKFLRQKPIDNYIADFYCSELQLVIEVDGDSHAESIEYDTERTKVLEALGLTVARYSNYEVVHNIEGVYEDLSRRIAKNTNTSKKMAQIAGAKTDGSLHNPLLKEESKFLNGQI